MYRIFCLGLAALLVLTGCGRHAGKTHGSLREALAGFLTPQDTARTKVWWFHGETETTREGITADLEAFRRAGVGGVVYYDQVHGDGKGACEAFSPEWWEMLFFAAREAARVELSFETHISNGFVAGGPWITPESGMQMLTATDTTLTGGRRIEVRLPKPESAYGCYGDVAVLAFPVADDAGDSRSLHPRIACNIRDLDAEKIFEHGKALVRIPTPEHGDTVFLTLDFGRDFTARSLSYQAAPQGKATTSATNVPGCPSDTFTGTGYRVLPDLGTLEASDNGTDYRPVCRLLPIYKAHSNWRQKTVSFPAVTARYFRLRLYGGEESDRAPDIRLSDVCLSSRACIDQWEEKAGLFSEYIEKDRTPAYAPEETVQRENIIDLTTRVDSGGTLRWDAPQGRWRIVRLAYVPTGGKTKHGRSNMKGLECDKLSAHAVEVHWNNYLKPIADSLKRHGGRLSGVAMDSHEAGSQNWTKGFEKEFLLLRGYDMMPYLPAMAGYVVGSREESDRFLFDVRRTIADLIAEKYYGTLQRLCRENGLEFTAQATGNALCSVADPIQAKGRVEKPQGEFWAIHPDGNYDIKECSSAAHLYGKRIASAEAFTDARFSHSLAYLKSLADYAYCFGINEFAVCASAYQPYLDKIPGNTGGGRHYCLNRNNTYWPYSRSFWNYQARCAFLMRQGEPVIDLCIYLGENAPVKILTHRLPEVPAGLDFDAFTTDALLSRMSADDGRIVLPDGMSYRMMVLPRSGEITWEALQKIASLVKAGVPVYGSRPTGSRSLRDKSHDRQYDALVAEMWGEEATPSGHRRYGKGTVYWGLPLAKAVEAAGIAPDLALAHGSVKKDSIYFAHRRLADADLYFIANHADTPINDTFTFHCDRTAAELWNPVTGQRFRLSAEPSPKGFVSVPLQLAAKESFFIVWTDEPSGDDLPCLPNMMTERREEIAGEWGVHFSEKTGGCGKTVFTTLADWRDSDDPRIKYYSGTAVYKKEIQIKKQTSDERVYLQFEALHDVARVVLGSDTVTTVWCAPYEADLTEAARNGKDTLKIFVANLLMNRMIGDASLPENEQITCALPPIITPDDTLQPSGIVGKIFLLYRRPPTGK